MQEFARKIYVQDSWQMSRNARTLAAYMALRNREIGERIAALRMARGNPPQEVVAQKLDVSNRSYQSWEAGDTKPSWRNLSKLAGFYGVSEEFILMGEKTKSDDERAAGQDETQLDRIEDAVRDLDDRLTQIQLDFVARASVVMQRLDEIASPSETRSPRRRRA